MSDDQAKTSYYLRLISMYIDLSTETALSVFKHHVPNKDPVEFLISNETIPKLNALRRKKILNKQEYDLVTDSLPDPNKFDISLLTTLTVNLLSGEYLSPPVDGWQHNPKSGDESIAADILRLRYIRNVMIGHQPKAQIELWQFDKVWNDTEEVLLRLQSTMHEDPEYQTQLQDRIKAYKHRSLDSNDEKKYGQQLREWHEKVLEIQTQADALFQKLEGFEVYFQNSSKYERYMVLMVKGGRFVLASHLNAMTKHSDLKIILQEKKDVLKEKISDPDQISILFPSFPSAHELDVFSWNVVLLANVLVHAIDNIDDDVRNDIEYIKHVRDNYAEMILKALSTDTYDEISSELKAKLKFISKCLETEQKRQCFQIIEECNQQQAEGICIDEMKSEGIKSIADIHKETLQQTKLLLARMINQNMEFKEDHVLVLKMITCGTNEQKKKLAENVLVGVWQLALGRSRQGSDFQAIEQEVYKILEEIKEIGNITDTGVEQKCIIVWVATFSPQCILALIEYFESRSFHERIVNISRDVGYYFDTILRIKTSLTIESLCEIQMYAQTALQTEEINQGQVLPNREIRNQKAQPPIQSRIRLPVSVASPAAMMKLLSISKKGNLAKSTTAIGAVLSKNFDERIRLDLVADRKYLHDLFDEDTGNSHLEGSNENTDGYFRDNSSLEKSCQEETNTPSFDGNKPNNGYDETTKSMFVKTRFYKTNESQNDQVETTKNKEKMAQGVGTVTKESTCSDRRVMPVRTIFTRTPRRRRKDFADASRDVNETEYEKFSLIGMILDVSSSMGRGRNKDVNEEGRELVRLLLQVIVEFVKNDVSRFNRIFTVGSGASQGNGTFDIISTIQRFRSTGYADLGNVSDDTIESIFQKLERNGASTIRKWVNKRTVGQAMSAYEADIILSNLTTNTTFADRCIREYLPASCRDWGGFGFLIQGVYAFIVSNFLQGTVHDVRNVVNQSITELDETVLLSLGDRSVYNVHDAAIIVLRDDKRGGYKEYAQQLCYELEPFIYGDSHLSSALREASDLFLKSVKAYPNHQKILFVVSDGCLEDDKNVADVKRALKEAKTTVVTLCISKPSSTQSLRCYSSIEKSWDDGAKYLFEWSSTFPVDSLAKDMFIHNGWQLDITDDNTKLFLCVHQHKDIVRFSILARNALCCRDSLVDLIPFVSVEAYISKKDTLVTTQEQVGENSSANSFKIVLYLAKYRFLGRNDGYQDIQLILDELSNLPDIKGDNAFHDFQSACDANRLHCRQVDIIGAMNAVAAKRSVIAKFQLTKEEWKMFRIFYQMNPTGILKKTDLDVSRRFQDSELVGHTVVLTGYNSECLRLMNSWGEDWADMGFFRIENGDVLGLECIDVYWTNDDLSVEEKECRRKHDSKVARKRLEILTGLQATQLNCPFCSGASNVKAFKGTLSRAFCPKCSKSFTTGVADRRVLALNMYLTLLSR